MLTTPLWRALRDAFPEAEIWWLTRPDAAPLIAPLVGPDRVLTFDKRGKESGLAGMQAIAAKLRALRFDVAIAVQRSLRTAVTLALAGIPERVGFAGAPGSPLYQHRVPQRGAHARDRLLALATPFGIRPVPPPLPVLEIDPEAASAVAARLASAGVGDDERLLVIAPGSAWETKRWPAERFAEAACALVGQEVDRVVVVGTAGDAAHAATIAAALARRTHGGSTTLDLCGRTSTAELVAVLARATLVLANDSAPAHVAAALRRPVVVAFGPTVPAQGFAPLGPCVRIVERELACRPCSRHGERFCPIGTHECMEDLPATAAVAAARALLAAASPAALTTPPERREGALS